MSADSAGCLSARGLMIYLMGMLALGGTCPGLYIRAISDDAPHFNLRLGNIGPYLYRRLIESTARSWATGGINY